MGIDFHNKENQTTYTTRHADQSWVEAMKELVPSMTTSKATDIGCGGGIYAKALADMGVPSVIVVDFSQAMLVGAKENCKDYHNITFKQGDALDTGLDDDSFQLVLERALIHHIQDLKACFQEAYRILEDKGVYIIQDRTPEDCLLKGDDNHIRGYFFERFPKLKEQEIKRRHSSELVIETLKEIGFSEIKEVKLWETRKVYEQKEQLLKGLQGRTGRSILHELNDEELMELVNDMDKTISTEGAIVEKDRWTIWKAVK
ncbi:class I SAM-dependent methyltransferase [Lysinibacillus sp. BPa_S21]|uniref:class I SAM-dependent methyltransferase n=1 Tax=Lysinibacillus sp. BPa_S21 TaxID=2932478 RepID=UPI002012FD04|nr:class I SAM-dependent methyltransferase [Lysinibacillus sp. BPa_S21]MCL1694581.1 class I SAM-dependent methyltransferase [Lysinibacillus sp. BPa_S21]